MSACYFEGAAVRALGGLVRGGRGSNGGFRLVSSSHRWLSWAMAHQPPRIPLLEGVVQCSVSGPRVGPTQLVKSRRGSRFIDMSAMCPPHWRSRLL
jgi:hypothetical protein